MASVGLVGKVIPAGALELLLQKFVDETSDTILVFICLLYWAVGEPLFVDNIEEVKIRFSNVLIKYINILSLMSYKMAVVI